MLLLSFLFENRMHKISFIFFCLSSLYEESSSPLISLQGIACALGWVASMPPSEFTQPRAHLMIQFWECTLCFMCVLFRGSRGNKKLSLLRRGSGTQKTITAQGGELDQTARPLRAATQQWFSSRSNWGFGFDNMLVCSLPLVLQS